MSTGTISTAISKIAHGRRLEALDAPTQLKLAKAALTAARKDDSGITAQEDAALKYIASKLKGPARDALLATKIMKPAVRQPTLAQASRALERAQKDLAASPKSAQALRNMDAALTVLERCMKTAKPTTTEAAALTQTLSLIGSTSVARDGRISALKTRL